MADGLAEWWDEDAERLNKLAEAARKFAVKVPGKTEDAVEESRGFCATGEGGGIDNSCGGKGGAKVMAAPDDGGGAGGGLPDSQSQKSFPAGAQKFRDAVDAVSPDPDKIWDRSKGLAETPPPAKVDDIASEQTSHSGQPLTPEAEASYADLVDEIGRQYEALTAAGLKVRAWRGEGEPYGDPPGSTKPNSNKMREEVARTGEFSFFMTDKGFGTGDATPNHPMLRETKYKTSDGEPMIANDLFRVVHDMVAHVRGGYSFSTNGEYNGMLTHASTLPESAWPALFAETFGQNAVYEKTGNYAPQNAYASKVGPSLIRDELKKRTKSSRSRKDDSDEPLGYQHLKYRPWLLATLSKAESRADDGCGRAEGGMFGPGNTCASGGSSAVAGAILDSIEKTGGFSVHPVSAETPTTGFMCAVVPDAEKVFDTRDDITEEAIDAYREKHAAYLSENPDLHLGGWIDPDTGKVYLDLSQHFESEEEAVAAGIKHNQLAVWDVKNKREVRIRRDTSGRRSKEAAGPIRLSARRVIEADRRSLAEGSRRGHGKENRSEVADCGRGPGGIFGPGNKCQEEGDGPTDAFGGAVNAKMHGGGGAGVGVAVKADNSWKKADAAVRLTGDALKESPPARSLASVNSVTIVNGRTLAASLKETGVTLDQAAKVCASLGEGSDVAVAHGTLEDVTDYMAAVAEGDESSLRESSPSVTFISHKSIGGIEEGVSVATTLLRDDEDDLVLSYNFFSVKPEAQKSSPVAIARELYRGVANSITEAEKAGVDRIEMYAAGDKDSVEMKGYRIWPRLGFDGEIPRDAITPRYSLRLGFFEPYGSNIPDSILSDRAKEEKRSGKLTIQALYETPAGQKWWEENGSSMQMSLTVGDESSPGWQRFSRIRDRVSGRSIDILVAIDVEWRAVRQEIESRGFCPTGKGNGQDNSCGTKDAGVDNSWKTAPREYSYTPGDGDGSGSPIKGGDDIQSLSIEGPKQVSAVMKEMKVKSLTDVVAIAGGLTRGASTFVSTNEPGVISVLSQVPVDPDDESRGFMSSTIDLTANNPDGKKVVVYGTMSASTDSGDANLTGEDAARMSSILLEKFPESLAAAERAGFDEAHTYAMGDVDSEFKGYRLWPQFGFDAEIYPDVRETIPKEIISHDRPVTVQELISTPAGKKWWNENGSSMKMTLNLKDKKSVGYKRYQNAVKLAKRLKARNEGRSLLDYLMDESRGFCPTGEGNGQDNSCGPDGAKAMTAPDSGDGGGGAATAEKPNRVRIDMRDEELDSLLDGMSLSLDQVVGMSGSGRDDADVSIRKDLDGGGIQIKRYLSVAGVTDAMDSTSVIRNEGTAESPEIVLDHKILEVSDDIKASPEKRHAAARECFRFMVDSVRDAQDAGVAKVVLNAARSMSDERFRGHTIWPRMGFDAKIPFDLKKKLPPSLSKNETLLDLHSTPEGTRWWRDNGTGIDVSLDLRDPNSPQMKVFRRFMERFGSDSRGDAQSSAGDGWLSPQDEAKLDKMWEQIWKERLFESRGFCPTGEGNGVDNSCGPGGFKAMMAPDKDSGSGFSPASSSASATKPAAVNVNNHDQAEKDANSFGVSGIDGIVELGGAGVRGANVAVESTGDGFAYVTSTWPVNVDDPSAGRIHTTVAISSRDGEKVLGLESFGPAGDTVLSAADQQRVISIISEKVVSAGVVAENAGFSKVTTFAVGDKNSPYKGYRLWPQFGFDGPVPRAIAKKIPPELILKAKGIEIPPPGSTSIPHDLVLKGLASRHRDITIQELISTHEGDRWWDENGDDVNLTLDLTDKTSLGYQKWADMKARLPRLKARNQTRAFFDAFAEARGFCPTGEGGGIDNSCGGREGGDGEDGSPSDAFGGRIGGFARKGEQKGGKAPAQQIDRPAGAPIANVTASIISSPPTQRSEDGKRIVSSTIAGPDDIFEMAGRDFFTTVAVGWSLARQQSIDRGGMTIDSSRVLTGANRKYVIDSHVQQVQAALARGVHPIFYTEDERQQQIDEYSVMEPLVLGGRTAQGFLVSPENAEFVLRAVQAITSSNASPEQNMKRTQAVLDKFFHDDGRIATSTSFGVTGAAIGKSLSRMQAIIDRLGERPDGSIDTEAGLARARELFVGRTMRVGDIDEFVRDLVGGEKGDWKPSSYLVDQEVPVFSVFGPKFGPFFANNNGDLDHLTADIWATRTFGRITGELVVQAKPDKNKGYAKDALKLVKSAKVEMLHGYDGDQLVAGLQRAAATGELDDVVRGWAAERLRHYARGDYTEKQGTGGKLNKLAKNIVENDTSLMGDPGSGTRRANMIDVYREVSAKTGLAVANAQDVLWQDEQDAYAAAGAKTVTAVGTPSFYSDVIREIARDPSNRFPRAEREGRKPKTGRAKKERRSFIEQDSGSYDDFERGGRENLLYWAALAGVSDEDFADKVIEFAERSVRPVGRSLETVKNTVIERRSAGQTTVTMPKAGRDGLYVMGFDGKIPYDLAKTLPESLSHCKTLMDLHVSDGGSEWWSENGRDIDVSIDLNGVQGRVFDGFAAGKPFEEIIEEGILDDYGNS